MSHGNYRRVHYTEAIAEAEDRDEILVTLDDVLVINQGSEAAVAIHIVGGPNFWEHDEPEAYQVELVRPRWLYGSEGHLYPLRWVGRVDEPTDAEFETLAADESHPYWDLIPESGSFLWAVPPRCPRLAGCTAKVRVGSGASCRGGMHSARCSHERMDVDTLRRNTYVRTADIPRMGADVMVAAYGPAQCKAGLFPVGL